ncbi:TerD family protein [Sphingomonas tabacisoli]|uniref:TerD family protein n=1 Tax=Sphingomonas tabacisoli TaxID=2249466 RepID=A0ABW4I1L6_9SPHN
MDLQQGANAPLSGARASVRFDWQASSGVEADASAYLLTAAGKVRGDQDMIFYNQPAGAGGAIRFAPNGGAGSFDVDLAAVPGEIDKIVFCATIHDANSRGQTLALLKDASIAVGGGLRFAPALSDAREAAMVFGELYRRNGAWKFRAVGQGFNGGLAPLARSFGIDVAEGPRAPAPAPAPETKPAPPPVRLSKVTLEKRGQTVSLEKRGATFGEMTVNLNWSRARGWLSGGAVDLDLGCLFELADRRKGVVQALGNSFGSFGAAPWIELSGDDRTGDVADGETLRINGARWPAIRRLCVFANIYDGAPNWQKTDGVVLVTMPDQPPIEVRMTDGRNDKRLCGVVMLENDGGRLKATRLVEYVRDQEELDRLHGWGLRWVAGRKD